MKKRLFALVVGVGAVAMSAVAMGAVTPIPPSGYYEEQCNDAPGPGGLALQGNSANDKIVGSDKRDLLRGGGGNDSITGNEDNDCLFGQADNDKVSGDDGDDTVNGGGGNDVFSQYRCTDY